MKVRLKRTFFWAGRRYRVNSNGVEVPNDAKLPSDAQIWDGENWVDAYPEGESPRDKARRDAAKRSEYRRSVADAVAGAASAVSPEEGELSEPAPTAGELSAQNRQKPAEQKPAPKPAEKK